MDDRFNTTTGWVLFAGVIALGLTAVSSRIYHADKHEGAEHGGFAIAGAAEADGGKVEMGIAEAMASAEMSKGEKVFAKCIACHTIDQGGATGIGPNLFGVVGAGIGEHAPGFAYSSALAGVGGEWNFENLDAWLKSPRGFANGTKMSFAGLGKIEDRAAVIVYMNANGSNLPLPEVVTQAEEGTEAEEGADDAAAEVAHGE